MNLWPAQYLWMGLASPSQELSWPSQHIGHSWLSDGQPRLQAFNEHSKQEEGRVEAFSMKILLIREANLSQNPSRDFLKQLY